MDKKKLELVKEHKKEILAGSIAAIGAAVSAILGVKCLKLKKENDELAITIGMIVTMIDDGQKGTVLEKLNRKLNKYSN